MDSQNEGPQAATRHVKDRRPAYNTNAARSIANLERRLSTLEGHRSDFQHGSPSVRCVAAADLDADLNNFGQMFNGLEERITDLESHDIESRGIHARLSVMEAQLKFYEEYKAKTLDALEQFAIFRQHLESAKSARTYDGVTKLVHEHEATLQYHSTRLRCLEDQCKLARVQEMSTHELARALVKRIKGGDSLSQAVSRDLRQCLDGTADDTTFARMPEIFTTNEYPVAQQSIVDTPIEQEGDLPRKRRRTNKSPQSTEGRQQDGSKSIRPTDFNNAHKVLNGAELSSSQSLRQDKSSDTVFPPERRSNRQARPAKRYDDMIAWKDVKRRIRRTK